MLAIKRRGDYLNCFPPLRGTHLESERALLRPRPSSRAIMAVVKGMPPIPIHPLVSSGSGTYKAGQDTTTTAVCSARIVGRVAHARYIMRSVMLVMLLSQTHSADVGPPTRQFERKIKERSQLPFPRKREIKS